MALQKTHTLPNSTEATYWKIVGIIVDVLSNKCEVSVAGYVNQAARQANIRGYLLRKDFQFSIDDPESNIFEQAYEKLKTEATENGVKNIVFFDGASDC